MVDLKRACAGVGGSAVGGGHLKKAAPLHGQVEPRSGREQRPLGLVGTDGPDARSAESVILCVGGRRFESGGVQVSQIVGVHRRLLAEGLQSLKGRPDTLNHFFAPAVSLYIVRRFAGRGEDLCPVIPLLGWRDGKPCHVCLSAEEVRTLAMSMENRVNRGEKRKREKKAALRQIFFKGGSSHR